VDAGRHHRFYILEIYRRLFGLIGRGPPNPLPHLPETSMHKNLAGRKYCLTLKQLVDSTTFMKNIQTLYEGSLSRFIYDANRLLTNLVQRQLKSAGHDLSTEQMRILTFLWMEDGQTQQALSDHTGKDKANITRSIHALEKRNIVVRVPNREDRRSKRIHLTSKGKELKDMLVPMIEKTLEVAAKNISDDEIISCKSTLARYIDNLSASSSAY
jgi:DNA-binding MarR family transcriptional regulator